MPICPAISTASRTPNSSNRCRDASATGSFWVLGLIKMWLVAPVEETDERGRTRRTTRNKDEGLGSPQGSPLTPPTMLRTTLSGAPFKRGGTDPIHDADLLLVDLDFLHQGSDD